MYGENDFGERARSAIQSDNVMFDNYMLFPLSSNKAILVVNSIWKDIYLGKIQNTILYSPILQYHFSLPKNTYVNAEKIRDRNDVQMYKTPKDLFTYTIHSLSKKETMFVNHLILNEAFQFVGLKTPSKFLTTVREYNRLRHEGMGNMNKNLDGFVELLSKLQA